jgi:hypothetical protein
MFFDFFSFFLSSHSCVLRIFTGGSSNLMGKFTQSVRRIVADVKDEGTMSGLSREEVIDINERLILFRVRLEMSYETAKQALNSLMAQYGDSKTHKNIFNRYPLLKVMIKVCSEPEKLISLSVNNHSSASSSPTSQTSLGSHQTRNSILDTRGDPQAGEAGNRPGFCDASVHNHGEDAEVGAEDAAEAVRGGVGEERAPGALGSYDNIPNRAREHTNDK